MSNRPFRSGAIAAIVVVGVLSTPGAASSTTSGQLRFITTGLRCSKGVCALARGSVGQTYGQDLAITGGSCGSPCSSLPVFTIVAGRLPPGLQMPTTYGCCGDVIGGTPSTAGTATFTVMVRDGVGDTARQAFRIAISPPAPLTISFPATCCLPGNVGSSYLQNFFLSGGVGPFTATISAGALPAGLHLSTSPPIAITGQPTTAGTSAFTVTVTDSTGANTSQTGRITIT